MFHAAFKFQQTDIRLLQVPLIPAEAEVLLDPDWPSTGPASNQWLASGTEPAMREQKFPQRVSKHATARLLKQYRCLAGSACADCCCCCQKRMATLCCSAWWACEGAVVLPDHVSALPVVCRGLQAGQPVYSIAGLAALLEAVAMDGERGSSRAFTAHPCSFHLTSTKPHPSLLVARSGSTPLLSAAQCSLPLHTIA